MISKQQEAEILRLHHAEEWRVGTIGSQLGLHHDAVERVLNGDGLPKATQSRPSMIEAYMPFIIETFRKHPRLTASRLHSMCRARGYPGGASHFRHVVAPYRPRPPAEAYLRLRTLPGEQAQVDWGHFGKLIIGRALRPLMAFVMVLSWCRAIFLRFFLGQRLENFLRGHVEAFEAFEGVPRVILYDNLKSAVLERYGDAIHFNPALLKFASHYHYEPRPVAVRRGNQKGRVERAIRYVRDSFFAARRFRDLDDLNRQADEWCKGEASDRPWPEDSDRTVREAFADERARLLSLPAVPFVTDERTEVNVGKSPYVRYDWNDYSVPHIHVRRTLWVVANIQTVRILNGNEVIAEHQRSFDRHKLVENTGHITALVEEKRRAHRHSGMHRICRACPSAEAMLDQLATRGHLGGSVTTLLRLLDAYGAQAVEEAISEALKKGVPHPHAVRQVLEHRDRARSASPPVPVVLSDPKLREITVRPHSLDSYDCLRTDTTAKEGGHHEADAST